MIKAIVKYIVRPIFVSDENGEFGVRIWGVTFTYYKYSEPLFGDTQSRPVRKREFGEVLVADSDANKA